MLKTLKKYFHFCNEENRKKLYKAMLLGVVKALFTAMRIPAIAVILQGILYQNMSMKNVWISLAVMGASIAGQVLVGLKTTMLQTEAGYNTCSAKRIEIAEHLRYLPMGFFNANSLGRITNITTNTMESLADRPDSSRRDPSFFLLQCHDAEGYHSGGSESVPGG